MRLYHVIPADAHDSVRHHGILSWVTQYNMFGDEPENKFDLPVEDRVDLEYVSFFRSVPEAVEYGEVVYSDKGDGYLIAVCEVDEDEHVLIRNWEGYLCLHDRLRPECIVDIMSPADIVSQ